jgi:hypothetical protein
MDERNLCCHLLQVMGERALVAHPHLPHQRRDITVMPEEGHRAAASHASWCERA